MKKLIATALCLCLATRVFSQGEDPYAASDRSIRESMINICGRCHGLDYYVTPRSRKAWELTVYRMRDYDYDQTGIFSDDEAEMAIDYLATHFDEDSMLDPTEHFAVDWQSTQTAAAPVTAAMPEATATAQPVEASPATDTAETAPVEAVAVTEAEAGTHVVAGGPERPKVPEKVRQRLENPPWRPGHGLMLCARYTGYSAVLCLFALLVTGHSRRRLRKRFRTVHATFALGLFLSLACHGLVYLARYGTPPVLWYWFGAASFLILVLAQLQGILRKRFGKVFLRIHMGAGYAGLGIAIFHWIWAWM